MNYRFFKRALDTLFSLIALLIFAPVMVLIGMIIKFDSRGPVLYKGLRAGQGGSEFKMYKFRSMVVNAENLGGYSTALNDPRLTRIGRFLRKFKLDELPQLLNVINGDMSLVGPRPQVFFYTDRYNKQELLILSVRPGITDLASLFFYDMDSVLGSKNVDARYLNEIEPQKNRLRLRYVEHMSLFLDIKILIATLCKVIGIKRFFGLKDYLIG